MFGYGFDWHPSGYLLNRLARTDSIESIAISRPRLFHRVRRMLKKKHDKGTAEIVQKLIDEPRISKSARIAEQNLDVARIPEPACTIIPGTVEKLIPAIGRSQPEKAQIRVDGADLGYRSLRIENSLIDEHGDEVRLKQGAQIEITVAAKDFDQN